MIFLISMAADFFRLAFTSPQVNDNKITGAEAMSKAMEVIALFLGLNFQFIPPCLFSADWPDYHSDGAQAKFS